MRSHACSPFVLFVVICFATVVVSSSSSTSSSNNNTTGENNNNTTNAIISGSSAYCPAIAPFPFWLRRQCPVLEDTRCANAFPSDVPAPPGQLSCSLANAELNARLGQLSARELLTFAKRRDPYGRPWCMLTLFYAPDCVFSAKVADTFFRVAPLLPQLRVVAVDVSVGGKGTESLISHYGISSTPVIALWQDGFPRYRLYDDYTRLDTLLRVLRSHTDLSPLAAPSVEETKLRLEQQQQKQANDDDEVGPSGDVQQQQSTTDDKGATAGDKGIGGEEGQETLAKQQKTEEKDISAAVVSGRHLPWWEPTQDEFLAQFHYLKEHLGFDWYLFAAVVTCLVNCVYFVVSSNKCRTLLRRHFPHHFAVFLH